MAGGQRRGPTVAGSSILAMLEPPRASLPALRRWLARQSGADRKRSPKYRTVAVRYPFHHRMRRFAGAKARGAPFLMLRSLPQCTSPASTGNGGRVPTRFPTFVSFLSDGVHRRLRFGVRAGRDAKQVRKKTTGSEHPCAQPVEDARREVPSPFRQHKAILRRRRPTPR